jgi:hypothetical protein
MGVERHYQQKSISRHVKRVSPNFPPVQERKRIAARQGAILPVTPPSGESSYNRLIVVASVAAPRPGVVALAEGCRSPSSTSLEFTRFVMRPSRACRYFRVNRV